MIGSMRLYLERVIPSAEDQAARLAALELPFTPDIKVAGPGTEPPPPRANRLLLFGRSGDDANVLRIGYIPDSLPFAYFNRKEQLVGYDVEMAARLARDMGLKLEFYPTSLINMATHLKEKRIDMVMSRLTLSASRIRDVCFSEPYQQLMLCGVVAKKDKGKFDEAGEQDRLQAEINIVMAQPSPHLDTFQAAFPRATFSFVDSVRKFYEATEGEYDILLTSMEVGSAWNMVYPDFTTVLVRDGTMKKELVYAASPENAQLIRKLNDWLRLQRTNGTMTRLYDYWVRGLPRSSDKKTPRWCIMRNVLGWGEGA
jgi:proton glutamate symport protein